MSTTLNTTVADQPFQVSIGGGGATYQEGATVSLHAAIDDPDFSSDSYSYEWSGPGDDTGADSYSFISPTGPYDPSDPTNHTWYTVGLTVTDDDNVMASSTWYINYPQGEALVRIGDATTDEGTRKTSRSR